MDEGLAEIRESAVAYLDRLDQELPGFVKELRVGDIQRLSMLTDVVEGAHWLASAAVAVGTGADDDTARLTDALEALKEGLTNRDYILLADILEYEILDLAADIRGRLNG